MLLSGLVKVSDAHRRFVLGFCWVARLGSVNLEATKVVGWRNGCDNRGSRAARICILNPGHQSFSFIQTHRTRCHWQSPQDATPAPSGLWLSREQKEGQHPQGRVPCQHHTRSASAPGTFTTGKRRVTCPLWVPQRCLSRVSGWCFTPLFSDLLAFQPPLCR